MYTVDTLDYSNDIINNTHTIDTQI
jgi:hypothetical protein